MKDFREMSVLSSSVTGFAIWYMGSGWFGGGCGFIISLERLLLASSNLIVN